jgi:lipid A oxidase
MYRILPALMAASLSFVAPAAAGEWELSGSLGYNFSPHSTATLTNFAGVVEHQTLAWDGASFEPAPYYSIRLLYWLETIDDLGFGIDYTHAKAVAKREESGVANTYSWLEFTDGLNIITANVFKKWDFDGVRVYVGAGAGVSIPHVEITTLPGAITGASMTREAQIAGPAVQLVLGSSYELFEGVRAFGEYKFAYTMNDMTLSGGAGTFSTNLINHQIVAGISIAINDGTGW